MNEQNDQPVDTSNSLIANVQADAPQQTQTEETQSYKLGELDIKSVPEKFIDKDTGIIKINDILKSNNELEKALHSRAPESYELDDVLQEYNLAWESEEQETEVRDLFKAHRISNDAAKEIISVYGKRITHMMEQFGTPYNLDTEMETLRSAWGGNTDARLQEISEFVEKGNMPKEVFTTSPLKTAAGIQLLYDMMKNTRGPNVMRSADVPVADLETQLSQLMNNPLYFVQNAEGDKVRKAASELSHKIAEKR